MNEVKTAVKTAKQTAAAKKAAAAAAAAAKKQGETPTVEPAKVETGKVIVLPVSIPVKEGAITKELFALDLSKLGKSVTELIVKYKPTFEFTIFANKVTVNKTDNFANRTFNLWLTIVAVIFKGYEPDEICKDEAKVKFLKAMPFKFDSLCFASVSHAVKLRKNQLSTRMTLKKLATENLNRSTVAEIQANRELIKTERTELNEAVKQEKMYIVAAFTEAKQLQISNG